MDIYDEDWSSDGLPNEMMFSDVEYFSDDYGEERWKDTSLTDISVSNFGRFLNTKTRNFRKPTHGDGRGHKAISTTSDGKAYAHRLIAEAFVPNPFDKPIVRHLDDNPDNNDISNLAWGTQLDNHYDSVNNGTYKPFSNEDREKHLQRSRVPVKCIDIYGDVKLFGSIREAAVSLGIQQSNLWKVLHGQRNQTCGYRFEYARQEDLTK